MSNHIFSKIFLLLLISTTLTPSLWAVQTDSLLRTLNEVIAEKESFTEAKEKRITKYHGELRSCNDQDRFRILQGLSEEYKTFIYDSAFAYTIRLQQEAYRLGSAEKIAYAKVKLAFILLSSGMFKETLDSLNTIRVKGLPDSIRMDYYSILARACYDLGDFDRDRFYTPLYVAKGNAYIDSARSLSKPGDYAYLYLNGLKNLKNESTAMALADLTELLDSYKLTPHQLAVTASTLSYYYVLHNEPEKAIDLLAQAAMADIRSATRETSAMSALAELLYRKGDVLNAYNYIQQAMDDAVFYGARQRKVQVGSILPVIAAARLTNVEEQRRVWLIYSTAITLLSLLVIVFAVITYKQLKKRKVAEKALQEANKIKEEYIGYYFNVNSEYLGKIEAIKKAVEMKLMTKKIDDIRFVINDINLKKEREALYNSFDKVFLKLFPDFVTIFNSYFRDEDRIVLKEGQLLNAELRIFALIRMGIHDTEKIARILDYSINTIYNYKARIKGRSLIPNEEFEKKIMMIHAL